MKKVLFCALVILLFLGLGSPAWADSIQFVGGPTGDGLEWDYSFPQPFSSTSSIDQVFADPSLRFDVWDGYVNLMTGPQTAPGNFVYDSDGALRSTTFTFGAAGSFLNIVGSVDGIENGELVTLLSGVFLPGSTFTTTLPPLTPDGDQPNGTAEFKGDLNVTFLHQGLLNLLFPDGGLDPSGSGWIRQVFWNVLFEDDITSFNADNDYTDVVVTPVPEPTTLVLLGTALLACAVFLRKRVFATGTAAV